MTKQETIDWLKAKGLKPSAEAIEDDDMKKLQECLTAVKTLRVLVPNLFENEESHQIEKVISDYIRLVRLQKVKQYG
jgi:hypothetical protein